MLQLQGLALNDLRVKSAKIGLYGRKLVTLAHPQYSKEISKDSHLWQMCKLHNCKIQAGDSVGVYKTADKLNSCIANGIVFKKTVSYLLFLDVQICYHF